MCVPLQLNSFCRSKTQKKRKRSKTDSTSSTEVKRQLSRQMSRQKSTEDEKAHVKETDTSKLIEEEKAESGNVHAL